jgi:ribosomal protein S12 methylthiotransferase accessory factor
MLAPPGCPVGAIEVIASARAASAVAPVGQTLRSAGLAPGQDAPLIVVISTASETQWRAQAAEHAVQRGVEWIDLVVDPGSGLRMGPLSHHDRSICGQCAQTRIDAAARQDPPNPPDLPEGPEGSDALERLAQAGAALLVRYLPRADASSPLHEYVITLDATATTATAHRVVAVHGCHYCTGPIPADSIGENTPASGDELGADTTDLAATLSRLAGWVDPLTGLITALRIDRPLGIQAGRPTVVTAAPPRTRINGQWCELPIGWGKGLDEGAAVISAVGETVERYSASLPVSERIVWAPLANLDGDVLDHAQFPLYSDEQYARPDFPFARFDPRQVHPWVRGHWFGTDRPVWVPAIMTFLRLRLRPWQFVCQGTSNGLAAGSDPDDAARRAVLELIERDAFLAAWHTGAALTPLPQDSIPEMYQPTLAGLRESGLQVTLSALTTSVAATTVACIGRGDGVRTPAACIGLATDLSRPRAVGSAILELAQTAPHLARLVSTGSIAVPHDATAVQTMLDHAAYFFPTGRGSDFDRLLAPDDRGTVNSSRTDLARQLREAGVRVAIVDVTAPDVASGPFRVARAISPDLNGLSFGHAQGRRLTTRTTALHQHSPAPPLHPIW